MGCGWTSCRHLDCQTEVEEEAEWQFRAEHDSTGYVASSKAGRGVFPHLKPSTRTISLRLPESMLEELKLLGNKMDVPYQSIATVGMG